MLTIPPPAIPAPSIALTEPLKLAVKAGTLVDGSAPASVDVVSAGILVFRAAPGGSLVWDQQQKAWRSAPADDDLARLRPLVATAAEGTTPQWEATLMAVGQKDATGADAYVAATNGAPSYYVRALVKAKRAGVEESGVSAASAPFTFADAAAKSRFKTEFDTPTTKSDAAHRVRMQLKGDALQTAGYLEIRAQPSFEVEIANCDASGAVLAKVLLLASGEIRLTPAAGARVVIDGDAETKRLLYSPAAGGAKQWL